MVCDQSRFFASSLVDQPIYKVDVLKPNKGTAYETFSGGIPDATRRSTLPTYQGTYLGSFANL